MDIYNYSNTTSEYVGTSQADPSPLEQGAWLIPASATDTAPPSVTDNEVAVFENGAWQKLADFRGTKYWTDSETEIEIKEIGVTVPANATTQAPPTENAPLYDLTEGAWVLNEARQRQASIPTAISSRQGKIALLGAGLLDNVEAALDAIVDPTEKRIAMIEYNHVVWNFDSPFLQGFWASLGGTQTQLEDLFIQASQL